MLVAVETDVTEDHPEVQALVQEAITEAEKMPIKVPDDMCTDVLETWIREVTFKLVTCVVPLVFIVIFSHVGVVSLP